MTAAARDDVRRSILLRAYLEAGQWKAEAWALADSLAWALERLEALRGTDDLNDLELAHYRLDRARRELA